MFDLTSWVHVLKNDEGYCNVINDCIKNNQILTIDNKVVRREFEEFFSKFTPQQLNAYCYGVSGSEAIEHALIIAEHITKKSKFLHFGGCYHGSSICLLNITYSETKRVSDYVFDILHPPYETKDIGEFPDMDDFFEKLPVENEYAGVIIDPSFGNMVFNAGIHFFLKLRK